MLSSYQCLSLPPREIVEGLPFQRVRRQRTLSHTAVSISQTISFLFVLQKNMAESFLFNIAVKFLVMISSPFFQEVKLTWGVWRRFRKAWGHLSIVKAVLLDAEEQQGQNQEQTVWLGKLKNIFYDAEDVLDEFKCEALRRQVVKTYGSSTRKVRCFPSSSNPLVFCFKVGHKIKEVRVSNS